MNHGATRPAQAAQMCGIYWQVLQDDASLRGYLLDPNPAPLPPLQLPASIASGSLGAKFRTRAHVAEVRRDATILWDLMMHLSFATQFRVKSIPNHINHCSITFILQENLRQRLFIRHLQAICREQLPCREADHLTDANIDPFQLRPSARLGICPQLRASKLKCLASWQIIQTCVYLCIYIYIHMCIYIYYIYIFILYHIYIYMCVCVFVLCVYLYKYVCLVFLCIIIYKIIHMYARSNIHAHCIHRWMINVHQIMHGARRPRCC